MSRSRLAPLGVATLAVTLFVAAFPIGHALLDDAAPGPDRDPVQAAAAPGGGTAAAAGAGRLTTATSCADLMDTLIAQTKDLVGAWGWEYPRHGLAYDGAFVAERTAAGDLSAAKGANTAVDEQSSSQTGTNVQENGIDEPDIAKTDGEIVVRADRRRISIFAVSDTKAAALKRIATVELPRSMQHETELLLVGDRLLALGNAWTRAGNHTSVLSIDVSDPAQPRIVERRRLDGELLSARVTGDDVRLVTATGLPDLDFVYPRRKGLTRKEAKARNRELLATSTIEQWLPQLRIGNERQNLIDCGQVEVPETIEGLGFLNVVGFAATDPAGYHATSVLTDSRIVYTSTDRLYLATGGSRWCCVMEDWAMPRFSGRTTGDDTTELHAFALDGIRADYLASGEVEGSIADRWAMDSADGVLRVAVSTTIERGKGKARRQLSSHSVVTLGERGGELVELGSVDGMGINESIQSVRWFDDLAIVVTFRQVDPLYAIDLGDPASPVLLGELKIPGFSSYLHPIGEERLLGLGTDATLRGRTRGAQAAVFDIAEPTDPRRVAARAFRDSSFTAEWEPRQVTWLPEQRTALAVLERWRGRSTVSVVALEVGADGALSSTEIPLGSWEDGYRARTLPLPDGRVVLSTQRSTRYLEW
ncbi:beta-propeller domain-containing protein [Nocardioides dubius]|uniref:Beta propeller domain-containing protein n=1 Tax=Nocardioides dubius TaxID=317019 RepID=A0ABN1TV49_9ACTN